jgi:hypothetical protein
MRELGDCARRCVIDRIRILELLFSIYRVANVCDCGAG